MRHVAWVMTGLLIVASGSVSFAVEPYPEKNLGLTSTGSSSGPQSEAAADKKQKDIIAMAEEFGLIVGPVTEDIRKELNLRSAEGVGHCRNE